MSEEKLTTNHIEKVLLEKKQKEFSNELSTAIKNLDEVLYKYAGSLSSDELKEFIPWFAKNVMTFRAPMGSRSMVYSNLHPSHYPKVLNDALLKIAVDQFIKSVEQTKATLDDVCDSINV